ncbi:hypothetical protein MMPV_002036 [Pyropia vietnamensis]
MNEVFDSAHAMGINEMASPAVLYGVLLVAALAVVATILVGHPISKVASPPLPAPSWSAYLPGGLMFQFYTAPHTLSDVLYAFRSTLGPSFRFRLGLRTLIVTCDPKDCSRIVGRPAEWRRPPAQDAVMNTIVPGGLFCVPRPDHAELRRKLRGVFGPAMLPGFWPAFQREMATMVERMERAHRGADGVVGHNDHGGHDGDVMGREVDLSTIFGSTTYGVIFNVAFGASYDEATMERMVEANKELLAAMIPDFIGYPVRHWKLLAPLRLRAPLIKATDTLRAHYGDLVDARTAETPAAAAARPADLLDVIIALGGDDREAVVSNALIFGSAGGATTAESSSWASFNIITHPGCAAAVVAELDAVVGPPGTPLQYDHIERLTYLRACWKESLRLTPPGVFFERVAVRDSVLHVDGRMVRAGTHVMAFNGATQRDPALWPHAEEFDPARWLPGGSAVAAGAAAASPGVFMPFSVGPENCAGTFLADFEGVLLLATLFHSYTCRLAVPAAAVRSVLGWSVRPGCDDPAGPPGNLRRGIPVLLQPRKVATAVDKEACC